MQVNSSAPKAITNFNPECCPGGCLRLCRKPQQNSRQRTGAQMKLIQTSYFFYQIPSQAVKSVFMAITKHCICSSGKFMSWILITLVMFWKAPQQFLRILHCRCHSIWSKLPNNKFISSVAIKKDHFKIWCAVLKIMLSRRKSFDRD